jgi:hypothetical protein
MKENEAKKWAEMQAMGKMKFIIADGIVAIGILGGLFVTYIVNTFFLRSGFLLVGLGTFPLMMAIGAFVATKKWTNLESIQAYDARMAKRGLKTDDDLVTIEEEAPLQSSNNKI